MDVSTKGPNSTNQKIAKRGKTNAKFNTSLARLSLAAMGVVFGDIATSPIYAIRECFHGEFAIDVNQTNVMGILSLIFWALVIIVGIKYLALVFRADNHGEGGVIALTALVRGQGGNLRGLRWASVVTLGLFAACLLYGDGMITPAISVLSAIEGIGIITPVLSPYIIPITIAILCGLFLIQRHGTSLVGGLFGPVILIWLCFLAFTGILQIVHTPQVLSAIFPWYAIQFLIFNKFHGFLVLGAVFLVVTGTEALYADIGHFGTRPIRLTWFGFVFPALVLNYFGQGALLLTRPGEASHPFYAMVPQWALGPTVVLATLATIIASQAVISGAFSLTRQAVQLGYLPRLNIMHTSVSQSGQIYLAPVNWLLMVCTIALVIGFQSSSKLAAAYGVAVTSTMMVTTTLFFIVMRKRWNWSIVGAASLTTIFFLVDFSFFAANISKVLHGAWFPLAIGAVFFTIMLTWSKGRRLLSEQLQRVMPPIHKFIAGVDNYSAKKIDEAAVFLTGNPYATPVALAKNIKHNKVIHERTILLNFKVEDIPRVPNFEKIKTEKLGSGFYRVTAHYGFMEDPKVVSMLTLAREQGLDLDLETVSFYIGRESLALSEKPAMARWRANLFVFMSRNASNVTQFFNLPADQVIEIGVKLEV